MRARVALLDIVPVNNSLLNIYGIGVVVGGIEECDARMATR